MLKKTGVYLAILSLGFSFAIISQAAALPSLQEQRTLEYISERDPDVFKALPNIKIKSIADYKAILEVYSKKIEKNKEMKDNLAYNKFKEISKELFPIDASRIFDEKNVLGFLAERYPGTFKSLEETRKNDLEGYWQAVISYNKTMRLSEANLKASPILSGLTESDKDFANQEAALLSEYLKGTIKKAGAQKRLFELAYPLASKKYSLVDLIKLINLEIEDRINKWDNLKKIAERR